jgi:uncharacterized Zn finger protein (UPF0148 family)
MNRDEPSPPASIQVTLQRENSEADEKFWAGLQGMNAELAEEHKEVAAKSARLAADADAIRQLGEALVQPAPEHDWIGNRGRHQN